MTAADHRCQLATTWTACYWVGRGYQRQLALQLNMRSDESLSLVLGEFLGQQQEVCEMMIAWEDLKEVADERFPREEIERYLRLKYIRKLEEFHKDIAAFEQACKSVSASWEIAAASEISTCFLEAGVELTEHPQVELYVLRMSAYADIRVGVVPDRARLLAVIRGARAAAACMAQKSTSRSIPARSIDMKILAHTDAQHLWHLGRINIDGALAIEARQLGERQWIRKVAMSINDYYSDFFIRALKPKLYALGLANRALEALNRRINRP